MKTRRPWPVLAALAVSSLFPAAAGVRAANPASPNAGPSSHPAPMNADIAIRLRHLTLDDAIDIALHRNPSILNQLQEIQRNFGLLIVARSSALPQLIATGSFQQTDPKLLEPETTGLSKSASNTGIALYDVTTGQQTALAPLSALLGGSETEADKNYSVTLEIQQTFYNAAIPPAIRQARFLRDAAYYTLRETVDMTVNTIKTDFYNVLYTKANIGNQEENLRDLQNQLTDQQNRFAAGTVPRFNVLQASVAVGDQRPLVIQAQNAYHVAYITLARDLGIEYGPAQEREAPIQLLGNLDYHPQSFSADEGVAAGKANRALLKQLRLTILADIENIRFSAAGYQPTLTGSIGLEAKNDALTDNLGHTLKGWFFGGAFNWNIFDGLATYGRVKQAKALLREARVTYEDQVNAVVQDIQTNYLTIQQDKELIASQVLNVGEAEEALRLSQARLSAGAGTQLDVLNSQQQLLAAQTTELQARFNYAVALGNYERVTGTSTVYDEAFDDPLTPRGRPSGADTTGAPSQGKALPLGTVKTPDVKVRGSGKPLPQKIDASTDSGKPAKPLMERDYLFQN